MKIHFERTGGFAGMKLKVSLDSETLSQANARQLERLLDSSRFFQQPTTEGPTQTAPDRFHYKVTVESDGGSRTMEASDASLPDEMRPLLDYLTRLSRTHTF